MDDVWRLLAIEVAALVPFGAVLAWVINWKVKSTRETEANTREIAALKDQREEDKKECDNRLSKLEESSAKSDNAIYRRINEVQAQLTSRIDASIRETHEAALKNAEYQGEMRGKFEAIMEKLK